MMYLNLLKKRSREKLLPLFLLLMSFLPYASYGQESQLSKQAQVSLITGRPGQDLYTIFGHSGIRIYDPSFGLDIMYSYGTFDFDTPDFYMKFVQGRLNYFLSVSQYPPFFRFYTQKGRTVYEQVLNLSYEEKNNLFRALRENSKPENRFYLYDFFYDNCSTRVRDILASTYGEQINFHPEKLPQDKTFRQLIDPYLTEPWVRFGIYLLLGMPADKTATPLQYMFLPDNLMAGLKEAQIKREGSLVPLAPKANIAHQSLVAQAPYPWFNPYSLLWSISGLLLLISLLGIRSQRIAYYLDALIFFIIGLAGALFVFMWFGTNHAATKWNLNILWALPSHSLLALILLFKPRASLVKKYFGFNAALNALLLITWVFLPQDLHSALIPLVLVLTLRSYRIYKA